MNIHHVRAACCALFVLYAGCVGAQASNGWWAAQQQADGGAGEAKSAAPVAAVERQAAVAEQPVTAAEVPPVQQAAPAVADVPLASATFDCVEVARFVVNDGLISSKEEARAATIPEARLSDIQRSVAGNIPEKIAGMRAALADGQVGCPDPQRTVLLTGRIIDFKKGNQALRYFVGFGAGAQKFSVMARAVRKSDGALLAEEDVTDRKVGGWIGGQADKGLDDFGEKVAMFVKRALPVVR